MHTKDCSISFSFSWLQSRVALLLAELVAFLIQPVLSGSGYFLCWNFILAKLVAFLIQPVLYGSGHVLRWNFSSDQVFSVSVIAFSDRFSE